MTHQSKYQENLDLIQGYTAFTGHCGRAHRQKLNAEIERLAVQNRRLDRQKLNTKMEHHKLMVPSSINL